MAFLDQRLRFGQRCFDMGAVAKQGRVGYRNTFRNASIRFTATSARSISARSACAQAKQVLGIIRPSLELYHRPWMKASGRERTGGAWKCCFVTLKSVVTFPYIYDHAGLRRGGLTLAKWCSAFQNGFFWSVAMAALSK
jgi:hypothetical protein